MILLSELSFSHRYGRPTRRTPIRRYTLRAPRSSWTTSQPSGLVARESPFYEAAPFDTHHAVARFDWQATEADGHALLEGIDIAFISPDGSRIERIIGFFGPLARSPQ